MCWIVFRFIFSVIIDFWGWGDKLIWYVYGGVVIWIVRLRYMIIEVKIMLLVFNVVSSYWLLYKSFLGFIVWWSFLRCLSMVSVVLRYVWWEGDVKVFLRWVRCWWWRMMMFLRKRNLRVICWMMRLLLLISDWLIGWVLRMLGILL